MKKITGPQYHQICSYLERRGGDDKSIDMWQQALSEDIALALGFEVPPNTVGRLAKEIGITLRRRNMNGATRKPSNAEVVAHKLDLIDWKLNRIMDELGLDCGDLK